MVMYGEVIPHAFNLHIVHITLDQQIIIDGDDHEIQQLTDIHQILQIMMKESDLVEHDIMCLVGENGTHYLLHGVI